MKGLNCSRRNNNALPVLELIINNLQMRPLLNGEVLNTHTTLGFTYKMMTLKKEIDKCTISSRNLRSVNRLEFTTFFFRTL